MFLSCHAVFIITKTFIFRDRNIQPKYDSQFFAGLTPLPRARRDHYRSLAKYYHALNALMHGKEDEGVTILEQLQTPQAFFALAQVSNLLFLLLMSFAKVLFYRFIKILRNRLMAVEEIKTLIVVKPC